MQAYSLYELNEYIRRVIALNFDEPVWIKAEISQYNEVRGQAYLDLVDHQESDGKVIAQSNGVIWYNSLLFIKKKLGELSGLILQEGSQVMIKVKVDYNERYGLKLIIEDIDATYTIGQLQLARQKIIERIKKEGFEFFNKEVHFPVVLQKIAIISSSKAAGYQDFIQQLSKNSYGYSFNKTLFPAAMQGQNVEREVVRALKDIEKHKNQYDCIVIIRGGGSKMDLSYFDNYNIAHAIAHSSLPVLTGIGHDIDESIADMVVYKSLKTPTAVADFILEHNFVFENNLSLTLQTISQISANLIQIEKIKLQNLQTSVRIAPLQKLNSHSQGLQRYEIILRQSVLSYMDKLSHRLEKYESILQLSDPKTVLNKGYAIVKKTNKIVSTVKGLAKKDKIEIILKDGHLNAEIQ